MNTYSKLSTMQLIGFVMRNAEQSAKLAAAGFTGLADMVAEARAELANRQVTL